MPLSKSLISTTAFALIAFPLTAQAGSFEGWYVGGSIGYNNTSSQTSEGENRLVETTFDDGITTSSYLGKKLDNNIRIEGEFAWRRNDGENLAFNGIERPFTAKGAESYSFLLNALYDVDTGGPITPYIGAGAGIGFIDNEFLYGPVNFEDSDTNFVWQGIVGATYPVSEKIELFVDAKYFSATGVNFVRTSPADNGVSLDSEYDNFSVSVGYRWNFK